MNIMFIFIDIRYCIYIYNRMIMILVITSRPDCSLSLDEQEIKEEQGSRTSAILGT